MTVVNNVFFINNPGPFSIAIPTNVLPTGQVLLLHGAGGGGSNGKGSNDGGGGGASTHTLTPGFTASQVITGVVGAGGSGNGSAGQAGGNTTVTIGTTTYKAVGGGGGTGTGAGGVGGLAANCNPAATALSGSNGAGVNNAQYCGGGGGAAGGYSGTANIGSPGSIGNNNKGSTNLSGAGGYGGKQQLGSGEAPGGAGVNIGAGNLGGNAETTFPGGGGGGGGASGFEGGFPGGNGGFPGGGGGAAWNGSAPGGSGGNGQVILVVPTNGAATYETGVTTPGGVDIGTGWTLSFTDNFTGTELNTAIWRTYGSSANGNGGNWSDGDGETTGIVVNNGLSYVQWEADGQWYGPGMQTRSPYDAEPGPYGGVYVTVEYKRSFPGSNGVVPYFLLWPVNSSDDANPPWNWPPECDIEEFPNTENPGTGYGGPNESISTYHFGTPAENNQPDPLTNSVTQNSEHVITYQFGPKGFAFWIDGVPQTIPASWQAAISSNPNNWMAGGGNFAFGIGTAAAAYLGDTGNPMGPNPLTTTIEYVSMWLYTG